VGGLISLKDNESNRLFENSEAEKNLLTRSEGEGRKKKTLGDFILPQDLLSGSLGKKFKKGGSQTAKSRVGKIREGRRESFGSSGPRESMLNCEAEGGCIEPFNIAYLAQ